MLGVSVPASAQIYESIFTDTNGIEVHAPSTRLLLNPASPVTLTLIVGLDRYVNVKITSATGTQLLNTTTTRTSVSDRLKAGDGSEFYGKKVTLPVLGEGRSVVQVSILDLNQSVVATYSYNWLVDTTPLSVNALTGNAAYGSTAGSVWKMGLEATGQFDFYLNQCHGRKWHRERYVFMSIAVTAVCSVRRDWSEDVSHLLKKNSVKGAGIPDSNLDEDFTAKVVIYDNAGNTRTLPLQLFRYDNYLGGPRSAKLRQRGAGGFRISGLFSWDDR
nr:hypothetical protein [Escherichia coli]